MTAISKTFTMLAAIAGLTTTATASSDCQRQSVVKVEHPNTSWVAAPGNTQIPIWPSSAKISPPELNGNEEMTGSGSPLIAGRTWNWATYIKTPTMTIVPPNGTNTGASLLVLPGGGYAAVAMDLEGTEICDWVTEYGVTCIILKYRVPQTWQRGNHGVQLPPENVLALEDAQRAMRLLRHRADDYKIDANKIGVIGFSAGAHLVAALSNIEQDSYAPIDAVDTLSSRPNYAVLLYPGRFLPDHEPSNDLTLAPWIKISPKAPPSLVIHAMNDSVNDVRHSMAYALGLNDAGVPVDLRVFADGCHAFGARPTSAPITREWPGIVVNWLQNMSILNSADETSRPNNGNH